MPSKKILICLSVFLFFSFIFFSYLVAKEIFTKFDFDTTVRLQDKLSHRFDLPFSYLSIIGLGEITGTLWLLLLVIALIKKYWLTSLTMFLFIFGLFIEVFGKLFVFHPAPQHFLYRGVITLNVPSYYVHTDYSYPSGHVYRASFLVAFLILFFYYRYPKISSFIIIFLLIPFLGVMMVSRVYLGEHWVSDVVGGVLLGTALGIIPALFIPSKR